MHNRLSVYGLYPEIIDWSGETESAFLLHYTSYRATLNEPAQVKYLLQAWYAEDLEPILQYVLDNDAAPDLPTFKVALTVPYAHQLLQTGQLPPVAALDDIAFDLIAAAQTAQTAAENLCHFYQRQQHRLDAAAKQALTNYAKARQLPTLLILLAGPQSTVRQRLRSIVTTRQLWIDDDEANLNLLSNTQAQLALPKLTQPMTPARHHTADEDWVEIDLNAADLREKPRIDARALILLLQKYLKFAAYKANNPPHGQYNVALHFLHHSKASTGQVEQTIAALADENDFSTAVAAITKLFDRHEHSTSGLHTNSVDTLFLQLLFAEGEDHQGKGLLQFTLTELENYRFDPLAEACCNGVIAEKLRGTKRLEKAADRQHYRLFALQRLIDIAALIPGAKIDLTNHRNTRTRS